MKTKITQNILDIWKQRYLNGETAREIWKDYQNLCAECTVERKIQEMGISRGKGVKFNIEQNKENIIHDYKTGQFYCYELAQKYHCNERTIGNILKEANIGVNIGKHSSCKEDYFEVIDTPNKAYLLGFITADGSIIGKYNSSCAIEVHQKDKALIEFAKKEINPSATITDCISEKKNNCRINFSSKKLCADLIKYGIVPNKSKIITNIPENLIPSDLFKYYFRGLIDGDGCIHQDGKISIYSGSYDFIQNVQEYLVNTLGLSKLSIYHGATWFISWSKYSDRQKLYNYLYKDCLNNTFYYPRKYQRLYNSLYDNTQITE